MSKDPAFLMYSKDWIEGTAEYMPDEKGVYIDLLCYQHQRGGLPTDICRLAKMVGLCVEDFSKIWVVISKHFKEMDNRLVNQKLIEVMNQRSEKGKINTITGTFAGLLRLGKYTSKQYKHLKENFKVSDFIQYNKEEITERLTEWLTLCLKSIEDENGIVLYKELLLRVISENSICLPDGFDLLILEWLKYKSEKRQSYKETGLKTFVNKFLKDSEKSVKIGREMLDHSMSKNYDGLFREKSNSKQEQPKQQVILHTPSEWLPKK